jgi:hypothetical protein
VRRVTITAAVLALVVPAVALARTSAPGDGTLVLKDANAALVTIQAKGGVVGRFDQGSLLIKDPNPGDDFDPVVTGADKTHAINDFWTRYSGKDVRFRFIGSRFTIRITGMANSGTGALGVDLSAVGQGSVILQGAGTADDGTYSFNGDAPKPLPLLSKPFDLGATL